MTKQIFNWVGLVLLIILCLTVSSCAPTWHFIRKGTKIDSLEVYVKQIDSLSKLQTKLIYEMNADLSTDIENIREELTRLKAKADDNQEQLNRVFQKLGISQRQPSPQETVTIRRTVELDPDELYNTAYLDYTRGDYDVAITGFRQYLKHFPDTELSDNAQYWIGECFYSKKLYPDAIIEFEKVISQYPQGNKVVAAIYKIGLAYESLGENKKAKEYYKRVFDNYPNSTEANLAKERYRALP